MLIGQVQCLIGDQPLVIVPFFGGILVTWKSKKQSVVACSGIETETDLWLMV